MTDAETTVITRNTRISIGALVVLVGLFGGTMFQAYAIREDFGEKAAELTLAVTRMEVVVLALAEDFHDLKGSVQGDSILLHAHQAKLAEQEALIRSLERRVDRLEDP